jgi:prolyl oligopeptidase
MRAPLTALLITAGLTASLLASSEEDSFLWLEDVHGARAMAWVEGENLKTAAALENDSRFGKLFADAKRIAEAQDRIPEPNSLDGRIFNFWQDADHPHGIWRQTSAQNYQTAAPSWTTVLDLDALSKQENANWFWKGADCHEPAQQRCIISLSDGGEDAVTLREFDLASGQFSAGGFSLPSGKQEFAWETADTLLVAREWQPGEHTQSGYAYVVKRLQRGQSLDAATEVFRGTPQDVGVTPTTLNDGSGHHVVLIGRGISIFESESYLVGANGPKQLSLPRKLDFLALIQNRLIFSLREDWMRHGEATLRQGSVLSIDAAAAAANPSHLNPVLVYAPGPREAFVSAAATRGHLLIHSLDNVNGRIYSYQPESGNRWSKRQLEMPGNSSVSLVDADLHGDAAFLKAAGYLTPPQLMLADLGKNTITTLKSLPAKFDASHHLVEQFEATSKDGTRIPYFIVHPAGMKMDGKTPTILYAYGGFLDAQTPNYSAELGKLWLERGGAFVLANIRGGGEFGPAWHEAGLKTNRQRIYDDFYAVAEDLIAKGFTSSAHLGIRGGSNGGLLMGVEFTQHPEMWSAVDIQIPLLDMLRYEQIAAGSSWVGEYGSVSDPVQKAFLASTSPYNNLQSGTHYPQALIWSTTKDDRVGPQHARKFAAKLGAMGVPYYYYEVTEGGHAYGATPAEQARMRAREYTYFSVKLGL